jgi:hypothetical protein
MKSTTRSGTKKLRLVAKRLFFSGGITIIAGLVLVLSITNGVLFLATGFILTAAGLPVMKKPELILLLIGR